MSRIGNKHIILPEGVTLTVNGDVATVTGPKGTLNVTINHGITVNVEGNTVVCTRENDQKQIHQNHGTTRANLNNAVVGVKDGFKKELEMRGIGYKAVANDKEVEIWAGYSHTIKIALPAGIKVTVDNLVNILVEGIDKQMVGQIAACIREIRPPEPYLGKGIRYKNEVVITKEGKRAGA